MTFAPGSLLGIAINGATHSQLAVSGTAALNGAHLSVTELAEPALDLPLVIVTNVTGTFEDLPEGAVLQVPTAMPRYGRFRISYTGGDGNDVTLTLVDGPPAISVLTRSPRILEEIRRSCLSTYGSPSATISQRAGRDGHPTSSESGDRAGRAPPWSAPAAARR